jgi:hypothetical protein
VKVTVQPRVAAGKLRHLVPPAYRDATVAAAAAAAAPAAAPEDGGGAEGAGPPAEPVCSLLLFAHAPRDVVPSPPVRKALRRLGEPAPGGVVAVGTVFTDEALALLAEAGARVVEFRRARWTDESAAARQL